MLILEQLALRSLTDGFQAVLTLTPTVWLMSCWSHLSVGHTCRISTCHCCDHMCLTLSPSATSWGLDSTFIWWVDDSIELHVLSVLALALCMTWRLLETTCSNRMKDYIMFAWCSRCLTEASVYVEAILSVHPVTFWLQMDHLRSVQMLTLGSELSVLAYSVVDHTFGANVNLQSLGWVCLLQRTHNLQTLCSVFLSQHTHSLQSLGCCFCWLLLYSAILHTHADSLCCCHVWFYVSN